MSGLEKLAAAIEAQGAPPCGTIAEPANRCQFWSRCAGGESCHEFLLWANKVTVRETGDYKRNGDDAIRQVRQRNPDTKTYRKVFSGG